MSGKLSSALSLENCQITKVDHIIAVITPIPNKKGQISKKTPVFHLPVYEVTLNVETDETQPLTFYCDLAELIDLIDKSASLENAWRRYKESMSLVGDTRNIIRE